jgi:hypothetical protein
LISQNYKLDTLAQVGKLEKNNTPTNNKEKYQKRARSIAINQAFASKLLIVNSPLKKQYFRTFECSTIVIQEGDKAHSRYCKSRACIICSRVRCANLITGYYKSVNEFKTPMFVTLTIPAVKENEIRQAIELMNANFNQVRDVFRKRKTPLKGLRKLESNFNPEKNTYNPHYHLLLDITKHEAKALKSEWLKRYPFASQKAQDIQVADTNTLAELFKYATKMITKGKFEAYNQDKIFVAFSRKRTVQSYGIKKYISEDFNSILSQNIDFKDKNNDTWVWQPDCFDWVNSQGETFSDYKPTPETLKIINTINGST